MRLVLENRHLEAHNLFGRNLMGAAVEQMKYQNMGNLVFNFHYPGETGPKPAPKDYSRSLDLATGIAQVAFTLGNIRYFRAVLVSPVDQVMAIRIWADQHGAITFTCQLRGVRNETHSNYGTDYFQMDLWGADGLALKGKSADYLGVEGKMRYSAKAKFIPKGGKITSSVQTLKVDQADEVIIYLAAATNFNNYRDVSADPEARVNRAFHQVSGPVLGALEGILAQGKWTGQGNPDVVEHPLTRAQCLARRAEAGVRDERSSVCGAPLMVPLYDPATQRPEQAKVCIDRYEFPSMPCDYPVTWVSTKQAHELCRAMGKRLCDAHQWEGGCAGALRPPEVEYPLGMPREAMEGVHNSRREKVWAYGAKKDHTKCATTSKKSATCSAPGWKACGSNTFPSGSFPECKSSLGVYDQHGNAAEHMWLPRKPSELSAAGGQGIPEMKGSWFIFAQHEAHLDDCRWRAPGWHANEGKQHMNYHLGFRCCKDL